MLAPAISWIDSKNVQTLLARVRPEDFTSVSQSRIIGEPVVAWGCATWRGHRYLVALEALRNKAIVAKLGTFGDAADQREYVAECDMFPTPQDALVSVLGEPLRGRMAA